MCWSCRQCIGPRRKPDTESAENFRRIFFGFGLLFPFWVDTMFHMTTTNYIPPETIVPGTRLHEVVEKATGNIVKTGGPASCARYVLAMSDRDRDRFGIRKA